MRKILLVLAFLAHMGHGWRVGKSAKQSPVREWRAQQNAVDAALASQSNKQMHAAAGRQTFADFLLNFSPRAAWHSANAGAGYSLGVAHSAAMRSDVFLRRNSLASSVPVMQFSMPPRQRAKIGIPPGFALPKEDTGVIAMPMFPVKEEKTEPEEIYDEEQNLKDDLVRKALLRQEEVEDFVPETPVVNMTTAELKEIVKNVGKSITKTRKELIADIQDMQRNKLLGIPIINTYVGTDSQMKWYMLIVRSNSERTIAEDIDRMRREEGLGAYIECVFNAVKEGATSLKSGRMHPGKLFVRMTMNPQIGKLLLKHKFIYEFYGTNEIRDGKKRAGAESRDRGFTMPVALSDEDFDRIYLATRMDPSAPYKKIYTPVDSVQREMQEAELQAKIAEVTGIGYVPSWDKDGENADFEMPLMVGDTVEVIEGPFKGQNGPVLSLGKYSDVVVSLKMMGREAPVTMPGSHCRRVSVAAAA